MYINFIQQIFKPKNSSNIMLSLKEAWNQLKIDKTVKNIRALKIQGASNIAKAALDAYHLRPSEETKMELIRARPTEPMLVNALANCDILGYEKTISHFQEAQEKISKFAFDLIKDNSIIFTHCHSTNVVRALIFAKQQGKTFQVYNTETRPLLQGRLTAQELARAGIQVTEFVDSAAKQAILKSDIVLFGADAILNEGIINKIGAGMFAEIAFDFKKKVYILADSWKYTKDIKLEERDFKEVWESAPEKIKVENPAFEPVSKKYIKAIVSELGVLPLDKFVKLVEKH